MTTKKITELPTGTPVAGDVIEFTSSAATPTSKQATLPLTGSVLAIVKYNPNPQVSKSSVSSTATDADATNLVIAFTAPPSGKVLVELSALYDVAFNTRIAANLRDGSGDIAGTSVIAAINTAGSGADTVVYASTRHYITGLTPGASLSYKWGIARSSGSGGASLAVGSATNADAGQAVMTVTSVP